MEMIGTGKNKAYQRRPYG